MSEKVAKALRKMSTVKKEKTRTLDEPHYKNNKKLYTPSYNSYKTLLGLISSIVK